MLFYRSCHVLEGSVVFLSIACVCERAHLKQQRASGASLAFQAQ